MHIVELRLKTNGSGNTRPVLPDDGQTIVRQGPLEPFSCPAIAARSVLKGFQIRFAAPQNPRTAPKSTHCPLVPPSKGCEGCLGIWIDAPAVTAPTVLTSSTSVWTSWLMLFLKTS